jgi:hypothetical protein
LSNESPRAETCSWLIERRHCGTSISLIPALPPISDLPCGGGCLPLGSANSPSKTWRDSNRWPNTSSAANIALLVLLLLSRGPADKLLTAFGDSISRLRPESELGWLTATVAGLYYALIACSILLLAIHALELVYWFGEQRIDALQSRLRASSTVESNPTFHASRIFRVSIHLLCTLLATVLVLAYFLYGLRRPELANLIRHYRKEGWRRGPPLVISPLE